MEHQEASVIEALGRAHVELLQDLRKLDRVATSAQGGSAAELMALLGVVQARMCEHFRLEEENGYMDTVRQRTPRLERAVQQLAEEHRVLGGLLGSLLGRARTATTVNPALGEEVRDWIRQVRQHELRENDLIQDAFTLDIGAGD